MCLVGLSDKACQKEVSQKEVSQIGVRKRMERQEDRYQKTSDIHTLGGSASFLCGHMCVN